MPNPSRRFVLTTSSQLLSCAALARFGAGCGDPPGPRAAGNVADLVEGELVTMDGFVVGRDAGGVYAMTAVCTHLSCDISSTGTVSNAGLSCSCHGSTFDPNGVVTNGPATANLDHFLVEIDSDGNLTVDTSATVEAAERLDPAEGVDTGGDETGG